MRGSPSEGGADIAQVDASDLQYHVLLTQLRREGEPVWEFDPEMGGTRRTLSSKTGGHPGKLRVLEHPDKCSKGEGESVWKHGVFKTALKSVRQPNLNDSKYEYAVTHRVPWTPQPCL